MCTCVLFKCWMLILNTIKVSQFTLSIYAINDCEPIAPFSPICVISTRVDIPNMVITGTQIWLGELKPLPPAVQTFCF